MQPGRFGIRRALLLKARLRTPEKSMFAQLCNRVLKTHESLESCVANFPLSLCHCRDQILISLKQLLIPTQDSMLVLTELLLLLPRWDSLVGKPPSSEVSCSSSFGLFNERWPWRADLLPWTDSPRSDKSKWECGNVFESTFSDAFENSVLSILLKTAGEGIGS